MDKRRLRGPAGIAGIVSATAAGAITVGLISGVGHTTAQGTAATTSGTGTSSSSTSSSNSASTSTSKASTSASGTVSSASQSTQAVAGSNGS